MLIKSYKYKISIINIYTNIYYIFMSIQFKLDDILYKINKMIVFIYLPKQLL